MEYVREILSFIAGAIAGGLTVRWSSNRSRNYNGSQTENKVGGDLAGRDIHKK